WVVGSGFVVRSDGLILTNEHVVHGASRIRVVLPGGRSYRARLRASDVRGDLAVLQIEAHDLPVAVLGDASKLHQGQWALALGNPYGLGGDGQAAMSVGIISAVNRSLPGLGGPEDRYYVGMIQTTAQISPGHSGGPLLNLDGEVIGINTAISSRGRGSEHLGFALPISPAVRARIERLLRGEPVVYGYLGVWATTVPSRGDLRGLGHGAAVWKVEPDSPADQAGLQPGDVILRLNDVDVRDADHLVQLVGQSTPSETVGLEVLRGRRRIHLRAAIAQRRRSAARRRGGAWQGATVAD
ncbi:MAG: S1C family serine protease, partial [Phycisphaerae bacterium]